MSVNIASDSQARVHAFWLTLVSKVEVGNLTSVGACWHFVMDYCALFCFDVTWHVGACWHVILGFYVFLRCMFGMACRHAFYHWILRSLLFQCRSLCESVHEFDHNCTIHLREGRQQGCRSRRRARQSLRFKIFNFWRGRSTPNFHSGVVLRLILIETALRSHHVLRIERAWHRRQSTCGDLSVHRSHGTC